MKKIFEKNVIAKKNISKGHKIDISHLDFKKSKKGIKAYNYNTIIGKVSKKKILKGQPIEKNNF